MGIMNKLELSPFVSKVSMVETEMFDKVNKKYFRNKTLPVVVMKDLLI